MTTEEKIIQMAVDICKYQMIVNMMLDSAELGYRGEEMRFDSEVINTMLKAIEPEKYYKKLNALQAKQEETKELING